MNQFVFLYPIPEIINHEVESKVFRTESEYQEFRERYGETLKQCIDKRYRNNGFTINYAVFDGSPVSDLIKIEPSDKMIEVGLDFKTHTTKQSNEEYPYPDQDYILDQLGKVDVLRIAGFHMWDCVERLAKRAYERGLDVLVDEDLTEFFVMRMDDPEFKLDTYPTFNARERLVEIDLFDRFLEARKEKPWLWQNY